MNRRSFLKNLGIVAGTGVAATAGVRPQAEPKPSLPSQIELKHMHDLNLMHEAKCGAARARAEYEAELSVLRKRQYAQLVEDYHGGKL